jgi:cyclic pyranopterin phosphate synthase
MCKALSHEIAIVDVRLLEKSGGRRDVKTGRSTSRRRGGAR